MQIEKNIAATLQRRMDEAGKTKLEFSRDLGIPRSTLNRERYTGRLRFFRPPGMERFVRIRCEWFDEWFAAGVSGGEGE